MAYEKKEGKKEEEKVLSKEERVKNMNCYEQSYDEYALLKRVREEAVKKFGASSARWCNEKKAYVSLPYGDEAKLEVVINGKTKAYPVIAKIGEGTCTVSIAKMVFRMEVSERFSHGKIDKKFRDSSVKFGDYKCKEENKYEKDDSDRDTQIDRRNRLYVPQPSKIFSPIEFLTGFVAYNE